MGEEKIKPRKVPVRIKKLIKEIVSRESAMKVLYDELYTWLENHDVNCEADMIACLQDGVGADELIVWLEEGHTSDYD